MDHQQLLRPVRLGRKEQVGTKISNPLQTPYLKFFLGELGAGPGSQCSLDQIKLSLAKFDGPQCSPTLRSFHLSYA
jgi:hypothetical protein